jgi:hypothetical protein
LILFTNLQVKTEISVLSNIMVLGTMNSDREPVIIYILHSAKQHKFGTDIRLGVFRENCLDKIQEPP